MAVDAYRHMLSLGLAPAPAAFRAVLGVHLQRGAWEEADAVLASMVQQSSTALDAEVRPGEAVLLWGWHARELHARLAPAAARLPCMGVSPLPSSPAPRCVATQWHN